ncbi:winged helix-turn-helix transcriptional regulator [Candidatus Bathyarchaeota archaeon]|nr:MAG: winged helix-turn-helix transcriptional regulator [Candidatus Bathyarchaeota archaeon]
MSGMRNVSRGLVSRTKIIGIMEKGKNNIPEISEKAGLSQSCVGYHLKLLLKHRVVAVNQSGRAGRWTLTKYGQEKLLP